MTHQHYYVSSTHYDPTWHATHVNCQICGFALPKDFLKRMTGQYKPVKPSQVAPELREELGIEAAS